MRLHRAPDEAAAGRWYGRPMPAPDPQDLGALDDHALASALAEGAGRLLADLRERLNAEGASAAELKAAGDRVAHDHLMAALATHRPEDAVCSEESEGARQLDSSGLRSAGRVWIVDPLDGTREYSEGRDDWAVHVALAVDGLPEVGAVALPPLGLVLGTGSPPALPPLAGEHLDHPRILVSRSRPPAEAHRLAEALDGRLIPMGSAGAKAMAVVRDEADIYPHSGGQYVWDNCAPAAVALSAGLWCSRIDGSPLRYDAPDPLLPDLLICRPELAQRVLDVLAT